VRGRPLPRWRADSLKAVSFGGKGVSLHGFGRDKATTSAVQGKTFADKMQKYGKISIKNIDEC
jgi:hypothetical protein